MMKKYQLYYITAAYFLFLIAILLIFGYTPTNDGDGYIEYAEVCLLEKQPYPCEALYKGQPFVWNPGAINLVALSLYLFHSIYPLLVLMCVLKAFSALFCAKIAGVLFSSDNVALATMIIYIVYPNNWGQSTTILSEIPMTFFALLAMYLSLQYCGKPRRVFLAGILFAVANWFRPAVPVFIIATIMYFMLFYLPRRILSSCSLLSGFLLGILVIGGESYCRTGHFVYQSSSLWFNISDDAYDGAPIAPHYGQDPYREGTPRYIPNMAEKTCFECDQIWKEQSLPWLTTHKLEYLKKIPYRLVYMYYNDIDNISAFISKKDVAEENYVTLPYRTMLDNITKLSAVQYLALTCMVVYYLIMVLCLCGTASLMRKGELMKSFLPIFIIVGGSLALVLLVHGETRFKAPFMPFIFMLAAYYIVEKLKERAI